MVFNNLIWFYLLPLVLAFFLVQPIIYFVRKAAWRYQLLDVANVPRKLQRQPVALGGGLAIALGFILCLVILYPSGWLTDIKIGRDYLLGISAAVIWLSFGGLLDDKYNLRPSQQIIWPLLAVISVLVAGIKVNYITNPWGGIYYLDKMSFSWGGLLFFPLAQGLAFIWLLVMIYTTKFLDGLDGLVSGITTIGALIIFIVSLFWDVPQSATSVLALLTAGLFGGFLLWNFYPAKIFLGEGGSTLAGLLLGILAIISGGKIATTLLVMGLPLLDVIWVVVRRIFLEKKSPVIADRKHLHFRLLDLGFSHRQAVLFLYLLALLFGSLGLFQNTLGKLSLFFILAIIMFFLAVYLIFKYRNNG